MVSCIEVETAALVFACLSLFCTIMASLVCIAVMVYNNVLMAYVISTTEKNAANMAGLQLGYSNYGMYMNVALAVTLSMAIVSLIFSIILTKGLLTKQAHLVKAYFIYGVTANAISVFSALSATLAFNMLIGLLSLFGCFLYCIILIIIQSTYLKLSTAKKDHFCHEKLESEKQIA